jgi:hypothetical protein
MNRLVIEADAVRSWEVVRELRTERAPCFAKTDAPTASSSAVVSPGRTARRIASRASATTLPARRSPIRSRSDSTDILRSVVARAAEHERRALPWASVHECP